MICRFDRDFDVRKGLPSCVNEDLNTFAFAAGHDLKCKYLLPGSESSSAARLR